MALQSHRGCLSGRLLALGFVTLIATPSLAADSVYNGTFRFIVRTGQTPPVPPAASIPTYDGTLNVTPSGGITIDAGDADYVSVVPWTAPPTFAGVLQETSIASLMNPLTGMAAPGGGPGPFTFMLTTPMGGGAPPANPTFGPTQRLGAISMAGGGQNYGGVMNFLFLYQANLVLFGGGGGQPNLACPAALSGNYGASFVATGLVTCVGLTTGPLPAQTLPSVEVPRHLTVSGFPATTRTVFAGAPAPVTTTTLTDVGSFSLNTGVAVPGGTGTTGMIQLVTPFVFGSQNGLPVGPSGQNQGAVIVEWNLTLLPEPGFTLLLLGSVAGLIAVRRLERRRSS